MEDISRKLSLRWSFLLAISEVPGTIQINVGNHMLSLSCKKKRSTNSIYREKSSCRQFSRKLLFLEVTNPWTRSSDLIGEKPSGAWESIDKGQNLEEALAGHPAGFHRPHGSQNMPQTPDNQSVKSEFWNIEYSLSFAYMFLRSICSCISTPPWYGTKFQTSLFYVPSAFEPNYQKWVSFRHYLRPRESFPFPLTHLLSP